MDIPFNNGQSFVKWIRKNYPKIDVFRSSNFNGTIWFGGANGISQITIFDKYITFSKSPRKYSLRKEASSIQFECQLLWGNPCD